MKITRLSVQNVQGISALEIQPHAPVVLVAGKNGSGKTTTLDAIAMATRGHVSRVKLKKDYRQAVREGQRIGTALVEWDGGRCAMTLPNGKHEAEGVALPDALDAMLNMHAFSDMTETARREWLYDALGISTDPGAIQHLLKQHGHDAIKVSGLPIEFGFERAEKAAREFASEVRGSWKAITGETYGDKKAERWTAPTTERPSEDEIEAARKAAEQARAAADDKLKHLGATQAGFGAYQRARNRLAILQEEASKVDRIRDKLERDKAELAVWTEKLASLPAAPGVTPVTHSCPECGTVLVMRSGKLSQYEGAEGAPDALVETKRAEQQKAVDLYQKAVSSGERDLAAAQRAAVEIETLNGTQAVSEEEIAHAKREAEAAHAAEKEASAAYRDLLDRENQFSVAASKTEEAKKFHEDVQAWVALAEALSPDGIPAEIVGRSVKPLNKLLREYADITGWVVPMVGVDMEITGDGRLYGLLSESEKWRVDAMLTVALAELSEFRMVALDRLDVLHPADRPTAMLWLAGLAESGRLEQVWLAGTLKQEPAKLPDGVQCVWLNKEEVCDAEKAAA